MVTGRNQPGQPFEHWADVEIPRFAPSADSTFPVPLGKRLVIEQVSALGILPASQQASFYIETTESSVPRKRCFAGTMIGKGPTIVGAQKVRLDAAPGTQVSLRACRDGGIQSAIFRISISGYLVDYPQRPRPRIGGTKTSAEKEWRISERR